MPSKGPMTIERLTREVLRQRREIESLLAVLGIYCPDRELDGDPKANPKIKLKLKRWKGEDFKGKLASECSPDFLDVYAETLIWMADNPRAPDERLSPRERDEELKKQAKYAAYGRIDAKRCRSWARRMRMKGWRPPPPPPEPQGLGDLPALGGGMEAPSLGDGGLGGDAGGLGGGLPDPSLADSIGKALDGDLAGPWDQSAATAGADDAEDDELDGIPE